MDAALLLYEGSQHRPDTKRLRVVACSILISNYSKQNVKIKGVLQGLQGIFAPYYVGNGTFLAHINRYEVLSNHCQKSPAVP